MAWSMRFEPDRILFQVKAGNQNLAYFEAHIPFLQEFSKVYGGGASGI